MQAVHLCTRIHHHYIGPIFFETVHHLNVCQHMLYALSAYPAKNSNGFISLLCGKLSAKAGIGVILYG